MNGEAKPASFVISALNFEKASDLTRAILVAYHKLLANAEDERPLLYAFSV